MSITISESIWGYSIAFAGDDPEQFRKSIESLKSAIPKKCRSYNELTHSWYVEKRAGKKLLRWLTALLTASDNLKIIKRREYGREESNANKGGVL